MSLKRKDAKERRRKEEFKICDDFRVDARRKSRLDLRHHHHHYLAMSYDMYFWRQAKELKLPAEEVLERLAEDKPFDGVTAFPRTLVREVFRKAFPEIVDGDADLDWEGAGSYFQVGFGHASEKDVHMIIVTCGHLLLNSEATMNRIIDVCNSLGCALYDPQTGQRYEQPEPKTGL